MPSAGAIQPPRILVMKDPLNSTPSHRIDTDTYIELCCGTPYTKVYFTTDGTKPNPFQIGVAGKESTFKYKAPFTLNAGKRTLKAISISRDGLQESSIITKTFLVNEPDIDAADDGSSVISSCTSLSTASSVSVNSSISNVDANRNMHNNKKAHKNDKNKEKQLAAVADNGGHSSHQSTPRARHAWGTMSGPDGGEGAGEGPFNPTNYSGTQINLWGVSPENWPHLTGAVGVAGLLPSPNARPFTPQPDVGFMTTQMMRKLDEQRMMTVADVRRAVQETLPTPVAAPPPAPAKPPVSEQIVIRAEPELNACSPGNGSWRQQLDHVYAHLIDFARSHPDFQSALGEPKMGKIVEADFVDGDHDTIVLTVAISRYGIPKKPNFRAVAKVAKAFNAPATAKPASASSTAAAAAAAAASSLASKSSSAAKQLASAVKSAAAASKASVTAAPVADEAEAPSRDLEPYLVTEEYKQEGTIKPYPSFNAETDCQTLHKAMKGIGTDEDAITSVLGNRSATQRLAIVKTYKTLFGKDLVAELKSEVMITGNYLKVLEGLCLSPAEFDAFHLNAAMKGAGTDELCLIEIICTRTNSQLAAVKQAYSRLYNKDLEKAVMSDTSGHFKQLLVALLQANRDESPTFDANKAKEDAQKLLDAGERKKWGTEESTFNSILVARSYPYLRAVFGEYHNLVNKDIEESIKSETSGDFRDGLLAIVRCIKNKPGYLAYILFTSMKGLGTNDMSLQRVIVSRCEMDMVQIKQQFEADYKQTLAAFIIDDTSGHFRKILLALIGEENAVSKKK